MNDPKQDKDRKGAGASSTSLNYGLLDFTKSAFESKEDELSLEECYPNYANLKQRTDRYEPVKLIARGGMKEILKVRDLKTERDVAMAKLRKNSPKELYEPFIREAMLAAKLEHPNIITVHDIGISEDESPFFTMELKMGDNLEQFLTKHGPKGRRENEWCSPTEMCQMFLKVCDAMSYAHSLGVLHLDLKPENIQIGHHGEVLVCDWGLGKIMSQQDQDLEEDFDDLLLNPDLLNNMTISGKIKGTPGYMAPEQVEKNISFDERTDIYALGCLLYAMLCGEAPMKGSVDEILEKTRQSNGLCPHLLCPEMNVPPSLDAIVTKATRKDPSDRYEAIDDLVKDI